MLNGRSHASHLGLISFLCQKSKRMDVHTLHFIPKDLPCHFQIPTEYIQARLIASHFLHAIFPFIVPLLSGMQGSLRQRNGKPPASVNNTLNHPVPINNPDLSRTQALGKASAKV